MSVAYPLGPSLGSAAGLAQAATGLPGHALTPELKEDVMRASPIMALALATAACGGGQNQGANGNGGSAAEPVTNQVAALSDAQRNGVFIRALRDAGFDCQHVERSVPAGTIQNMPAWRATCQGGGEWTILITADGSAQILPQGTTIGGNQSAGNSAGD
jgi:hypothetical protein